MEGKPKRENPKRTISASGGLGLLQLVLEPGTERCVAEDTGLRRGFPHRLEKGTSASEDATFFIRGLRKGVDCVIPHQLGRRTKHSL